MSSITQAIELLRSQTWIDLSHPVHADIPHFPAFSPIDTKVLFTVEKDGFFANQYTLATQYGTHIDAPIHFAPNTDYLHELDITEFLLPLIVINKVDEVANNADYRLTVDDILAFEKEHGQIPKGSFVAFASGWSDRWQDKDAFYNKDSDGNAHAPGWSLDALKFLNDERQVTAIGHETLDTDSSEDFRANGDLVGERYWLSQNKFQIEVMNNLKLLPATGGAIFVGVPNIKDAPGFNARVLAIVPKV